MADEVEIVEAEEVAANEVAPPAPEPVKPPTAPKSTVKLATKTVAAPVASNPTTEDGAGNESLPAEVVAIPVPDNQRLLATRVAADAYEASTDRESFAKAFIADGRLDGTTDSEGQALLVVGNECVAYWLANKIEKPTSHIPG